MEIGNLIPHIESLIFASEKPLTSLEITELINNAFGFMEDKIVLDQVEASLEGIVEKYKAEFYPFEVRISGGGWQFLTKKDYHKTVAQLNGDKFLKRLSTAALETLSIIAYKQPVTKAEIEGIRGVSSDYAIQKLLEKELIVITGRNEKLPGHPLVYATSKNFMDYFGINSAEDLPKLKEVFDETMVNATIVNEGNANPVEDIPVAEQAEEVEITSLVVAENGELIEEGEPFSEEATEETEDQAAHEEADVTEEGAEEEENEAANAEEEDLEREEEVEGDDDQPAEGDENEDEEPGAEEEVNGDDEESEETSTDGKDGNDEDGDDEDETDEAGDVTSAGDEELADDEEGEDEDSENDDKEDDKNKPSDR